MYELVYTSVKQGLLPGRSGFATAAATIGIPPNLIAPLENISIYKPLYAASDSRAADNPVSYALRRFVFGNNEYSIASRTAFAGVDYSGRTNKLSHHILYGESDIEKLYPDGLTPLLLEESNFIREWPDSKTLWLPIRSIHHIQSLVPGISAKWEQLTGDAGWAGVAAERFMKNPDAPLFLEYPESVKAQDLLRLFAETLMILPPEFRQSFTYDTYVFQNPPAGTECFFRAVPVGTSLIDTVRKHRPEDLISLVEPGAIPAEFRDSPFVEFSRNGTCTEQIQAEPVPAITVPEPEPIIDLKPEPERKQPELPLIPTGTTKPEKHFIPRKKLLIAAVFALFFLLILSLLFLFCLRKTQQKEQDQPVALKYDKTLEEQVIKPAPPSPPKPAIPQTPPKVVIKIQPVKKETQPPCPRPPERLPLRDQLELFIYWNDLSVKEIMLSAELSHADGISAEFKEIGSYRPENLKSYSLKKGKSFRIYAVKKESLPDIGLSYLPDKTLFFQLSLSDGKLKIQDISGQNKMRDRILPSRKNIRKLRFHFGNQHVEWNMNFTKKELAGIKHGKLEFKQTHFLYRRSEEEMKLGRKIRIVFFSSETGKIMDFNDGTQLIELIKEWNSLLKQKTKWDQAFSKQKKAAEEIRSNLRNNTPKDSAGSTIMDEESPKPEISKADQQILNEYSKLRRNIKENQKAIASCRDHIFVELQKFPGIRTFDAALKNSKPITNLNDFITALRKKIIRILNNEV